MTGSITADREAALSITLVGSDGREQELQAIIDTGFTGYLTLPPSMVATHQLAYHSQAGATLGDGSRVALRKFEGRLIWHGQERDVMVLELDGGPLVGMALLYGSRVTLDVVDGGTVTIETLP